MRRNKQRGTISVFVALMMIPVIAVTGLSIDFSRLTMAEVQTRNAAYLASTSALAFYDGLLYEVFGLIATSQNQAEIDSFALQAVETALGLNRNTPSLNLFGPGTVDSVTMSAPAHHNLENLAFLRYQIANYMQFRAVLSLFDARDGAIDDDAPPLGDALNLQEHETINPDRSTYEMNFALKVRVNWFSPCPFYTRKLTTMQACCK